MDWLIAHFWRPWQVRVAVIFYVVLLALIVGKPLVDYLMQPVVPLK
jgi:hypothetical protein